MTFETRQEYRKWLGNNCLTSEPVWIEFFKDGTRGITYNEALEESLCFGWIDSLIKKIDARVYVRKFSKRRPVSRWSAVNRKKVKDLITRGLMTRFGLNAVEEAKRNGSWDKVDERDAVADINGFRKILKDRTGNAKEYDSLSESLKKHYSLVYFSAKKKETRNRRLEMIIEYMKTKKKFM